MATYSNQHWLLCHIRNSFVSTDDTGICETVMQSDDLPKHFAKKFDCYPGLDQSDEEDIDLSAQSFDIQMYPEVGAHRFRSNTAQKLEKMDIARRKAARTKCISFDDEIIPPEDQDFFIKKEVGSPEKKEENEKESELAKAVKKDDDDVLQETGVKSKLSLQLANSPKQTQNKFMEYARFDGTSQTGIQTKRINVFLNMLPERERNYPIKICVIANAKILEVIGLVCYKATIQFPDIPLKSIRHYALYMTEDNDDMEDFPPLDNREPCSKFGFSHLTLAERRPLVPVTRIDYNNTLAKSTNSEEEKARLTVDAVRSLQSIQLNGGKSDEEVNELPIRTTEEHLTDYETSLGQLDMLEAPLYRTYRLNIIDKPFFKTEVTLGISGERIEIDQRRNAKFWCKQKAVAYPIESVVHCEILERRNTKATLRIYLKASSSFAYTHTAESRYTAAGSSSTALEPHSPTSPGHSAQMHASSPFSFLHPGSHSHHHQLRFKHYDFEAPVDVAEHIEKKLNCILEVRTSEARREFLHARERKLEKQAKKHLKM